MAASGEDASEIERLKGQLRGLEEQLQRLVRTEQRLYYAQREVARQLERVERLNAFSIDSARCRTEHEILDEAIQAFLSLFPYDQALAFLRASDGRCLPVLARAVKGREGRTVEELAGVAIAECTSLPQLMVFPAGTRRADQPPAVETAIGAFERLFGPSAPEHSQLLLFSLSDGAASLPLGLLVLRREGELGFHEA